MSFALVTRSLELFEDDFLTEDKSEVKKKKKSTNAMKMISTNRKGVWQELRKLKNHEMQRFKKKSSTKSKSALEKYHDSQSQDYTEDSVYLLKRLSEVRKTQASGTKKILDQHRQKLAKDEKRKRVVTKSTVFSDKDFEKFQKEYFSS